jgi:hypothetical protein
MPTKDVSTVPVLVRLLTIVHVEELYINDCASTGTGGPTRDAKCLRRNCPVHREPIEMSKYCKLYTTGKLATVAFQQYIVHRTSTSTSKVIEVTRLHHEW